MKPKAQRFKQTDKHIRFENADDDSLQYSDDETPKKWFEELVEDPKDYPPITDQVLIELKEEAQKLLEAQSAAFLNKRTKSNSDYRWMKTIMSKGTVADKIAANTVSIQDNPLAHLDTLRSLVSMVKVGKKKECLTVMQTLTELFLKDLLVPDRKLRPFHQRPLSLLQELSSGNVITRKKLLCLWSFEDQLKEVYTSFVLALNTAAHDTLDVNKEKAISCMYQLLAGNPEQEKNLLTFIVNKLGDPSQKVASKSIYCLSQLLYNHWNMQEVVLGEVEKLLFRSNVSSRAQYYGLCFLSQFYLSHEAQNVARKLVEVYFSFFKACIKKGEVDSRMMSALLMGVNRAYPYAKLDMDKIKEHINTMYKIVHVANFNVSLHALTLLYQVSDHSNNINDRFYSALYRKLFDIKITKSTHQAMLLNLIYKALLRDTEVNRTIVFIKRLLQVALYVTPCFACGILYLVSQLLTKKPSLQAFKSQKQEFFDDDDEEKYEDVKTSEDDIIEEEEEINGDSKTEDEEQNSIKQIEKEHISGSWFHASNSMIKKDEKANGCYQPMARNPLHAGGEYSAYFELTNLQKHFHPSVALFASNILKGEVIKYSGDPLKDFTLIRFLDRFVFKNPKKAEEVKQGSHPTFGIRKNYLASGVKSIPVYSGNYMSLQKEYLPADEQFLFWYLQKHKEKKIKSEEEDDDDADSVASEEFEEMLHKMSGLPKDDSDDLDFMHEIGNKLQGKEKENEENSDEELEVEEDEMSDDLEEEDLSDNGSDFDDDIEPKAKRKKFGNKEEPLFAPAEEFASLLEEEGTSKIAPGGSQAVSNKDNANVRQLDWEEKRNRWVTGLNRNIGKKGNFNKGHKRPQKSNFKRKK